METDRATTEALADEARRARKVRQIVDISTSLIMQGNLSRAEAEAVVQIAREQILKLFPDGDQTFEILYTPKFARIIDEFVSPPPDRKGVVLPFRRRQD